MATLMVKLDPALEKALLKAAARGERTPARQAAYILRIVLLGEPPEQQQGGQR